MNHGLLSEKKRFKVFSRNLVVCVAVVSLVIFLNKEKSYNTVVDNSNRHSYGKMDRAELGSDALPKSKKSLIVFSNAIANDLQDLVFSGDGSQFDRKAISFWLSQLSDQEIKTLEPVLASWMNRRGELLRSATLARVDEFNLRNIASVFDIYVSEYAGRQGEEALQFIAGLPLELGAVPYARSAIDAWHRNEPEALRYIMLEKATSIETSSVRSMAVMQKELQYYFEVLNENQKIDLDAMMTQADLPTLFFETAISTVIADDESGGGLQSAAQALLGYQKEVTDPYVYRIIAEGLAKKSPLELNDWLNQIETPNAVDAIATGLVSEASKMDPSAGLALITSSAVEHLASIASTNSNNSQQRHASYINDYVVATLTRSAANKETAFSLYQALAMLDSELAEKALRSIEQTMQLRYGAPEVEKLSQALP